MKIDFMPFTTPNPGKIDFWRTMPVINYKVKIPNHVPLAIDSEGPAWPKFCLVIIDECD